MVPRLLFRVFTFALVVACISFATYQVSRQIGREGLQATGQHRLELYSASLEREIGKYAFFPTTLGVDRDVLELLDTRRAHKINTYLEQLNERAGTLATYVMNDKGVVLASSNWQRSDSYVGEDLSFRPYFQDAIASGRGRFFGIGTTRGEPGYYLSSPLLDGERIIGVATVKVSLEQLEASWSTVEAPVLVADENGVVILSSVPDWKFTTLRPLDDKTRAAFDLTLQFNRRALQPLGAREILDLGHGARIVRVAKDGQETVSVYPVSGEFLAQSQPLSGSPWTLTVLSHLEQVEQISKVRAAVAGVTTILLGILAMLLNTHQRHLRERAAARGALQKAYDELERKVAERTLDLSSANERLQAEIVERRRTERTLRAAQEGLIQAGKLAVIGQLSAGIVHELNQPLAALRTLSGNAIRFLERGEGDTARSNLARMGQLVDRMGEITGQLRTFARKSSGTAQSVDLEQVVGSAVSLLEQRLRSVNGSIVRHFPPGDYHVSCDANRMEQVLINLIGNALDAMAGHDAPQVEVTAAAADRSIRVEVRDHGPGLSPEACGRLFEPFFTTKEAGEGLGLGLAISAGIVGDFGGTLRGTNHPAGGALFTIEMPSARDARRP
jgi:C4-dicarboxylate-specific signal transduction histidine kinase